MKKKTNKEIAFRSGALGKGRMTSLNTSRGIPPPKWGVALRPKSSAAEQGPKIAADKCGIN